MMRIPLIGRIFKYYLYLEISFIYDVVTNFEEGHRLSFTQLTKVIKRKEFLKII